MKTLEQRLATIVSLLPPGEQERFTGPRASEDSTDSLVVEATAALAKAEGLVCQTRGEPARAGAQRATEPSLPAIQPEPTSEPADEDSPEALAARFAAITDPRAQTAFWRSLTAEQRAAIIKAQ